MTYEAFPLALALAAATFLPSLAEAQARTYVVRGQSGDRVQFTSDAPLETMRGTTSSVSGEVTVDPANLASASGAIEVQLATLRTGIDLRDEHLRSDTWLDTARYPTARFELVSVGGATQLTPGQDARLTLRGRFTLHGRTRNVTANAQVQVGEGGASIRVRARFRIALADYGISIPSVVQLKVANEIAVEVSFRASAR